jgi:hypothetical protein
MVTFHGEGFNLKGFSPRRGTVSQISPSATAVSQFIAWRTSPASASSEYFPQRRYRGLRRIGAGIQPQGCSLGDDVRVLCISKDLPFAHSRFCSAEGIENVLSLSTFRDGDFGRHFGLEMANTKLAGLLGRAVIVADATER